MNNSPRTRSLSLLLVALFLGSGCHGLHLTTLPSDNNKPPPKDTPAPPPKEVAETLPSKQQFRLSQYVFYSDFELNKRLPLFAELASLRDQVYRDLKLPAANSVIQVYLFEDRQRYERFMKSNYPRLPNRRAFFVALPRGVAGSEDLLVYTYWGDRIQEDLRHELTHALIHSVIHDVPLWLDEGLAEYFEVAPGWGGINYNHLDRLRQSGSMVAVPDMARLEQMDQVAQMAPAEYREAWAWVHFMLHTTPPVKKVLVTYLKELRTGAAPPPLRPRLAAVVPALDDALEKHLTRLEDSDSRPQTARK